MIFCHLDCLNSHTYSVEISDKDVLIKWMSQFEMVTFRLSMVTVMILNKLVTLKSCNKLQLMIDW